MSDEQHLPNLPPEAQQLLNAERRSLTPPSGARDRVRARVGVTLGLAAAVTGAATTAKAAGSGTAAAAGGGLLTAKVLAPLGIGTLLLVGVAAPRLMKTRDPAPVVAPVVVGKPAPTVVDSPVETPVVVEQAPTVEQPTRTTEKATPRATGLAQERRALDNARTLIHSGAAAQAITALQRHQHDFPHGQLAEERDALHVMALAKLGRTAQAREAARTFSRRHPGSVLQSAVDAALSSAR